MQLVLKIAWRNILRHKGKSFVIGIILFLGAFLMTLGNGVIAGMDRGLEDNIINSFLGHLVIVSEKQKSDNVLFEMYGKSVAPIYNYREIREVLKTDPSVDRFLPVGKNMAMSLNEDSDFTGVFLLGVDFKKYREMFGDNIKAIEGRLLKDNEKGVLVPSFARNEFYNFTSLWIQPEGSRIVEENLSPEALKNKKDLRIKNEEIFMGLNENNSSTDVRLGVKGIIRYKALNTFWGHFLIVDIDSYRECLGYFSGSENPENIPDDKKKLMNLDNANLDDMFGESEMVVEDRKTGELQSLKVKSKKIELKTDTDDGVFNLVFIKLKNPSDLEKQASELNKRLEEKKLGVRVITWKQASGIIGSLAVIIKGFLFGFVIFLFVVAIIIIVNTLSMAALERVSEIGMMRAVGAQKKFIRNMFVGETAILSGLFGGAGILIGIITVSVLPSLQISTQNDMIQLLYGGDVLNPFLNSADILITLFQLLLVTLLSVIYPVSIAKNITPLDAITRD